MKQPKDQQPKGELVVDGFEFGMASHPIKGFGLFRNLDIVTNPGTVRLNNLPEKKSGSVVTGTTYFMVADPVIANSIWASGTGGVIYHSTDNGSTWAVVAGNSGGNGGGLAIWKRYLFAVGTAGQIDVYGNLDSSPGWTNNFQTIDNTQGQTISPMFNSIDGKLYIGNGQYISSIAEVTTFVAGTASTYTWTSKAITLAPNYQVRCMEDLGVNLMVGTAFVTSASVINQVQANIFPYNRSTLTLGISIQLGEQGVNAMKTVGNRLYALAGSLGKIFVTDSVSSALIAKIPNYAVNYDGGVTTGFLPGAICLFKGRLLFGLSGNTGNNGVWSYDIIHKTLTLENIISTGNDGTTNALNIYSLCPISSDQYLIGWNDNTTYGIDKINNTLRATSGYFESPLYQVGETLANKTEAQLEYYLTKLLVSGQGLIVKYRYSLDGAWTTLGTYTFTTDGGVLSANKSAASITNAIYLQFQVTLTTGASNLTPEFRKLVVR